LRVMPPTTAIICICQSRQFSKSAKSWIAALDKIESLKQRAVIAGHKARRER